MWWYFPFIIGVNEMWTMIIIFGFLKVFSKGYKRFSNQVEFQKTNRAHFNKARFCKIIWHGELNYKSNIVEGPIHNNYSRDRSNARLTWNRRGLGGLGGRAAARSSDGRHLSPKMRTVKQPTPSLIETLLHHNHFDKHPGAVLIPDKSQFWIL